MLNYTHSKLTKRGQSDRSGQLFGDPTGDSFGNDSEALSNEFSGVLECGRDGVSKVNVCL